MKTFRKLLLTLLLIPVLLLGGCGFLALAVPVMTVPSESPPKQVPSHRLWRISLPN